MLDVPHTGAFGSTSFLWTANQSFDDVLGTSSNRNDARGNEEVDREPRNRESPRPPQGEVPVGAKLELQPLLGEVVPYAADFDLQNNPSRELLQAIVVSQFRYSIWGLRVGVVCMAGGIALFILGIGGTTSWIANFPGVQSQLADAAPGALLFVAGVLIIWITRYQVHVKTRQVLDAAAADGGRRVPLKPLKTRRRKTET